MASSRRWSEAVVAGLRFDRAVARLHSPTTLNYLPLRRLALALLGLASLTGCYLHHRLGDDLSDGSVVDARARDAGVVDAAISRDASRDASMPDASLRCPLVRADFACLSSFLVQPGFAFALPLSFDTLTCCGMGECAVSVDDASQTLRLTTTRCEEACACAPTQTLSVECAIPALRRGDWVVEVNGSAAYRLPVMEDSGLVPPPAACVDFAEGDACTGSATLDGHPQRASRTCATQAGSDGRYQIDVTDSCGSCDRESTCGVTLELRFTDDLPPGGDLRVSPTRFFGACDGDCIDLCMVHERGCSTPPLERGQFYRVFVGDTQQITFTAGIEPNVCNGMR